MTVSTASLAPDHLSAEDRAVYGKAGFGNNVGLGQRPALVVIDVQYRTVGPDKPVLQAIEESYPTACGERGWRAIETIVPLLQAARDADIPIIYPYVAPKQEATVGAFAAINPAAASLDSRAYDFVAEVAPRSTDILVPKQAASAFFGTALAAYLIDRQVDTIILTGCTTSGCIRATAVDGFSLNLRTAIAAEGVYDRAAASHEMGLFELSAKYADVCERQTLLDYLESLG